MLASRPLVLAAVVVTAVACSKNEGAPTPPAPSPTPTAASATTTAAPTPTPTAAAVPKGPPGTIAGVVTFTGTVPAAKAPEKITDPVCAAAKPTEETIAVGKDKGLRDVLVRIEVGGAQGDAPATVPQLKQEGCQYVPHVLGVVAGADVEILNADKTMHNIHTYKGSETLLNAGQPSGSPAIKKALSDEAGIIKVKCDVHPWMTAYVVVTDHPYFAVTDADGKFSIANVPAGSYTIEAWHPELGTIQKKGVTVTANGTIDPGFTFTGSEKKSD